MSVAGAADFGRLDVDALTRAGNATESGNVFGGTDVVEDDFDGTAVFGLVERDDVSVLLKDAEDLHFDKGERRFDGRETGVVAVSDAREHVSDRIEDHKDVGRNN